VQTKQMNTWENNSHSFNNLISWFSGSSKSNNTWYWQIMRLLCFN